MSANHCIVLILKHTCDFEYNTLPNLPILGFSNSASNKDMTNMDKLRYNYLIELRILWEKEKLLVTSHFSFFLMFSKTVCCLCIKMSIYGVEG